MIEDIRSRFSKALPELQFRYAALGAEVIIRDHMAVVMSLAAPNPDSNEDTNFIKSLNNLADACGIDTVIDESINLDKPYEWYENLGYDVENKKMIRKADTSRASMLSRQKLSALITGANLPIANITSRGSRYPSVVNKTGYQVTQIGDTARIYHMCSVRLSPDDRDARVNKLVDLMVSHGLSCGPTSHGYVDISLNQAIAAPPPAPRKMKAKAVAPAP